MNETVDRKPTMAAPRRNYNETTGKYHCPYGCRFAEFPQESSLNIHIGHKHTVKTEISQASAPAQLIADVKPRKRASPSDDDTQHDGERSKSMETKYNSGSDSDDGRATKPGLSVPASNEWPGKSASSDESSSCSDSPSNNQRRARHNTKYDGVTLQTCIEYMNNWRLNDAKLALRHLTHKSNTSTERIAFGRLLYVTRVLIYYEYTLPENVVERARLALLASNILVGTRVPVVKHACVFAQLDTPHVRLYAAITQMAIRVLMQQKHAVSVCYALCIQVKIHLCSTCMAIFVQLVSVLKADIDSNRARINEINKLADMLRASMANGCQLGLTCVSGNTYALPCIADTCCRCLKPIVDDDRQDLPVNQCKQCAAPVHSEHEHQLCAVCFQPLLAGD